MAILSLKLEVVIFLYFLFVLLSFATAWVACPRCEYKGKVSYFSEESALSSGACAYGSMALDFNHGYLAAASFDGNEGRVCGRCYRVRCENKRLCKREGTTVIVTDELTNSNSNKKVNFSLSRKAYMAMAKKGMEKQLLKHGAVHVTYKSYPCDFFNNKNLTLRVEESSKWPDYLAVKVLYQGGQTNLYGIFAYPVSQVDPSHMMLLSRNGSAVFDNIVTSGPLKFEFVVRDDTDNLSIFAKNVFPADWKPGMIFDTGVQIRATQSEGCYVNKCPNDSW
ncbi:Expansin-like [Melia azedarach]|uniref:Expansin-like n=1 Tax=Melia azedarach TaxID=155640 RepID=A0ACC1Y2A4_MELAZ|nr:Expansin-like [Melia azedarach]